MCPVVLGPMWSHSLKAEPGYSAMGAPVFAMRPTAPTTANAGAIVHLV